ncbi:MAG: kdpC [Rickettsiaceae bacterium]|jgi:K+-transporting ATPase ATPase C chain|nr:kdpC [Rickettsiaceae bacterium]
MIADLIKSLKTFIICGLLIGGLYNFFLHLIGSIFFPYEAKGSMLMDGSTIKGSALLSQKFTSEKYFHARPRISSSFEASTPFYDEEFIFDTRNARKDLNKYYSTVMPIEMSAFSGSNLDPYISVAAAKAQVKRVSEALGVREEQLFKLIENLKENPIPPFFTTEKVNVTKLNFALSNLI